MLSKSPSCVVLVVVLPTTNGYHRNCHGLAMEHGAEDDKRTEDKLVKLIGQKVARIKPTLPRSARMAM